MRAVYFNDGKVESREIQESGDQGVIVHVRSIGICGSDLHMLEMRFPLTCIVGHEVAGVLDDGRAIAVEPMVPCGECDQCQTGDYNLCAQSAATILGVCRNGAMADELCVPESSLLYLPTNVDVSDACLVEPLAVAVHGIRKADLAANQQVAVIGGGTIGLCAVAVAKSCNARVDLSARYSHQTQAGSVLGAGRLNGNYDLVIDCAGTQSSINQAVEICRPAGRILLLATYWQEFSFPHMAATMKELTIIPSHMYSSNGLVRDFDVAASLLSRNPKIAPTIITHRFPMSEVESAFATARDRGKGAIKVVLEP